MGYENVGRVWTPQTLREYLYTITPPVWCKTVTLHHTASPSLAQRPQGWKVEHLHNLESYYRKPIPGVKSAWSAGPHLFVDEDQLWGMCDFRKKGVHSLGFNSTGIGIEVLGDYSKHGKKESPASGRGLQCWRTAAAGTKVLLDWLGLSPNDKTVSFHREDGKTQKDCPGSEVTKAWVLGLIAEVTGAPAPSPSPDPRPNSDVPLQESEWRFVAGAWCVPVRVYLLKKGFSSEEIAKNLRAAGGKTYYGTEWLEGATYDAASKTTWAPLRELNELKP